MNEKSDSAQSWGQGRTRIATTNRKIMPKSTHNTSGSETNSHLPIEKENMETLDFNHLPQVQRIVKLERDSSFGKIESYLKLWP
jgi:hypothetical protein